MARVKTYKERCKSCGLCIRECPRGAIELTKERNAKGYQVIRIDEEKCVQCGICYWVCPDCVMEVN